MSSAPEIPRTPSRLAPAPAPALDTPALTGGWLTVRATAALLLANARYWSSVAPKASLELGRWESAARKIPDPRLSALALAKLREERFNPQLAATLATLAPRSRHKAVVEAVVALQVLYDFLDVLGEQPLPDPLHLCQDLPGAFTDAVDCAADPSTRDYYAGYPGPGDGGYVPALIETVRSAVDRLPSWPAIVPVARESARRCTQAQILNHSAPTTGAGPLRRWATIHARGTALGWQEYLAGASASVLAVHALIAAAADPASTPRDAIALDRAYLSIGALAMLDSVVDYHADLSGGRPGYLQYYDDPGLLGTRLAIVARAAKAQLRRAPHAPHHLMTLVGIAAYYLSDSGARSDFARPIGAAVRAELRPLMTPTLALMRGWRLAKRLRRPHRRADLSRRSAE